MLRSAQFDPPTPRNFARTPNFNTFTGWYADELGHAARAIRLRIGRRLVPCRTEERPDVQAAFQPGRALELATGFHGTFTTGPGLKLVRVEALRPDGRWERIGWRLLRVGRQPAAATSPGAESARPVFRSGLDGLWQSCLGLRLRHTPENCALTWVIPDFSEGGGGHLNIFRMIRNLEELGGPSQQVLIVGRHTKQSGAEATELAQRFFFKTRARVYLPTDAIPTTGALMATCWQTAYFVQEQPAEIKKFYFVQDYEPLFYTCGSNSVLAENTYGFGFPAVTAGTWLRDRLAREHGTEAVAYGFSFDRHLYRPPVSTDFAYDIFFYARPSTERRMFDLGIAALSAAVAAAGRPLRIAFAGSRPPPNSAPFPFTSLGILSLEELGALYGRVRCALVLSATNASLLPYELMACGCPVVTNQGPNNEWLFPEGYGGVAAATPAGLGGRLAEILTQPDLRDRLSAAGLRIVAGTDWLDGARHVLEFLRKQGVA